MPKEYVKNNEIVLNVGFEATSALKLGNELIEFKARFGGTSREIAVPIDHVIAIYARENGPGHGLPDAERRVRRRSGRRREAEAAGALAARAPPGGQRRLCRQKGGTALTLSPSPLPARPGSSRPPTRLRRATRRAQAPFAEAGEVGRFVAPWGSRRRSSPFAQMLEVALRPSEP